MPQLAMITDAAQGIGRAIVERLGADGFDVLALDAVEQVDVLVNNAGVSGVHPSEGSPS